MNLTFNRFLQESYNDFYEGQRVIINPRYEGSEGKVGEIFEIYQQDVIVKNLMTNQNHIFNKADVYDIDSDEAQKYITNEVEEFLDTL